MALDAHDIARRALAFGVFGDDLAINDEAQGFDDLARLILVGSLELLAADFRQLGCEGVMRGQPLVLFDLGALAVAGIVEEVVPLLSQLGAVGLIEVGREDAGDLPVFLGDEGFDFTFALDDQADGHALHTAGAQAPGDLPPQQRADLIADDAVEDAPRLLGIDAIDVDLVRVLEGLLDLGLGDGVKDDAAGLFVGDVQRLLEVPGDGFSFAVQVGREVDAIGFLRQRAELADDLIPGRQDLILGLERLEVDAHALGG